MVDKPEHTLRGQYVSRLDERELQLLEAFMAGFEESGEGFNGEYVGERYRATTETRQPLTGGSEAFHERMIEAFQRWRNA